MTAAYAGLVALDAILLAAGHCVLVGLGVVRSMRDGFRYAGLALVCGWATLGVLGSLALMLGASLAVWQVVAGMLLVGVGGIALRRRGTRSAPPMPVVRTITPWAAVVGASIAGLMAAALFRRSIHATASTAYDAWAFWIPRARSLVAFDGIDLGSGAFASFAHPDYPPLVPALESVAFRFMGGIDASVLPVQHWVIAIAFLGAVAAIGARTVEPAVVWTAVAMIAVLPQFGRLVGSSLGDEPLALLFALTGACAAAWLVERRWELAALACLFGAATTLAKAEGLMLVSLLAVALVAATVAERSRAFRVPGALLASAVVPAGLWRIWVAAHGLPRTEGYDPLDVFRFGLLAERFDRLRITLGELPQYVFEPGRWLWTVPLVLAAAVLSLARQRAVAVLTLVLLPLGYAGIAVTYWISQFEVRYHLDTSAERVVASLVLFAAAMFPFFFASRRTE